MPYLLLALCLLLSSQVEGALAGGRPNSFSGGVNAFAGISNPANAVWIPNRLDVGFFWVHQKSSINNLDNNPRFPPGKFSTAYRKNNLYTYDVAVTRQFKIKSFESSFSLAYFTAPNPTEIRTKEPLPGIGTTPLVTSRRTEVVAAIFSLKLNKCHSIGFSLDYFFLSQNREGQQNADNPERSVSPGNVTNNGTDHSGGLGFSLGWRWKITPKLDFGLAWIKKCSVGQFKKYQGFDPHHGRNYIPQSLGGGFGYRFTSKIRGRLEALWINLRDLPGANNNVLPNGELNRNKRGSNNSPGPGLQNATLINLGVGYKVSKELSFGAGYSHRLKHSGQSLNILSHTYRLQTIYDRFTLGANYKCKKHELFLTLSRGFKNTTKGSLPEELDGGRIRAENSLYAAFISWGYLY